MRDDPLLEKVEETIRKFDMFCIGSKIVVGISGGPDSTVLLHVLYHLRERFKIKIRAAYLNHCLRGEEVEREKEWVKDFTRKLGVPLICDCIDVALLAKEKRMSLESAAREARYGFLEHVANQVGASRIAVGHTASDQAETLLMRLVRGSGLDGLAGIPPVRGRVVRPMIEVFRWEVEEYCQRHNLTPREDSTNRDVSFFRNSIRLELIPYLTKRYNPKLPEILVQTTDILRVDKEFLQELASKAEEKVLKRRNDKILIMDIKTLSRFHLSLKRRLIRNAIERLKGNLRGITYDHINDVIKLLGCKGTKILNLPEDVRVIKQYDELILSQQGFFAPSFFSFLEIPGKTEIPQLNLSFETEITTEVPVEFSSDPFEVYFDFDKLPKPLFIRPRKEGDRFVPLGMKEEKKLKKFFIDAKVPLVQRDKVPILVGGDKILWVVGYRIDERFKVDPTTKKVLKTRVLRNVRTSSTDKPENKGNRS